MRRRAATLVRQVTIYRLWGPGALADPSLRGRPSSIPQRSIVNPCMYTNGHRVPGCH